MDQEKLAEAMDELERRNVENKTFETEPLSKKTSKQGQLVSG